MAENEVFETNHYDVVYIESLVEECSVVSLVEYERMGSIDQNVFFTRASYDPSLC